MDDSRFKAINFDLGIKELIENYSPTHPNNAYRDIAHYLENNNFSHRQYSGYRSQYKLQDLDMFDLIENMHQNLNWLDKCVLKFDVNDIGENYDFALFIKSLK